MNLHLSVVLERKHPDLAAFVVVPAAALANWSLSGTTTVEGTVDGVAFGRRSLVRWDDDRWFVELRRETLDAIGKGIGETVSLELWLASTALPAELVRVLREPGVQARWDALTEAQRRMLREDILAAKTPATRERRARKALVEEAPERPPVVGLPTSPAPVRVRIVGSSLPGRECGPYTEVQVGMPAGAECPEVWCAADTPEVTFEAAITVLAVDGAARFRGPAVNGPTHERFLYLAWIGRKDGGPLAMFRRAKLRLDAVPIEVLTAAVASGVLLGEVGLTDRQGMPLCASVLPPVIRWSAG